MGRITGLLLAAGQGRRAGGPKALRTCTDGTSWVVRAARTLRAGGCDPVLVVVGAAADEVRAVLATEDVRVVHAVGWKQGMGASLRAGLAALEHHAVDVACIHLVDLPDVGADVVSRVLASVDGPGTLARAAYCGRPGHPVLLGRTHWSAVLASAQADRGARDHLAVTPPRLVDCSDLALGHDVDGPPGLPSASGQQIEVPGD